GAGAPQPLVAAARAASYEVVRAGSATTTVRELVAMARVPARGASLLVELKAVEPAYPLYGRLETVPAAPFADLIADRGDVGGAVVEAPLLERLGIAAGDPLLIGSVRFTVTRVLVREPDRPAGLGTLGPRVLRAA